MDLATPSEKLPNYPPNIQGELRIILQTKDIFMVCYRQLEEYRRLVDEQKSLITKEFVQEQMQLGEEEIEELRLELCEAESRLEDRLKHNEILAQQLVSHDFNGAESGPTARHLAILRAPQTRKQMLAQRRANQDEFCHATRNKTRLIDNIAIALEEIHNEVRTKVKPLLDFYRDLYYLQLHFSIVLGQVCNYCMPLVTENIGFLERVFFWSDRPGFELIKKSSDISDRLKEIYTRSQQICNLLSESVHFLQSKVDLQKTLETRFHEKMDEQQKTKDKILRDIHNAKLNMDALEEENDRLVGCLVKLDPNFVDSQKFADFAEARLKASSIPRRVNPVAEAEHEVVPVSTTGDVPDTSNTSCASAVLDAIPPESPKKQASKKFDECSKKTRKKANKHEASRRTRSSEQRSHSRRRPSKRSLDSPKTRTLSSGERKIIPAEANHEESHRGLSKAAYDTESENTRPQSELFSTSIKTKEEVAGRVPLKTRLLDRTKGLLDLSRIRKRDSDDSSSAGGPVRSDHMERGDSNSVSFPTLGSHKNSGSSVGGVSNGGSDWKTQGDSHLRTGSRRKSKMKKHKRSKNSLPELQQVSFRAEDIGVFSGRDGERESRNSKSRNLSAQSDIANYLSSSRTEAPSSSENSILPAF